MTPVQKIEIVYKNICDELDQIRSGNNFFQANKNIKNEVNTFVSILEKINIKIEAVLSDKFFDIFFAKLVSDSNFNFVSR